MEKDLERLKGNWMRRERNKTKEENKKKKKLKEKIKLKKKKNRRDMVKGFRNINL